MHCTVSPNLWVVVDEGRKSGISAGRYGSIYIGKVRILSYSHVCFLFFPLWAVCPAVILVKRSNKRLKAGEIGR